MAHERKKKAEADALMQFIDEQSLDEGQSRLLQKMVRFDKDRKWIEVLKAMSDHYLSLESNPLKDKRDNLAPKGQPPEFRSHGI